MNRIVCRLGWLVPFIILLAAPRGFARNGFVDYDENSLCPHLYL